MKKRSLYVIALYAPLLLGQGQSRNNATPQKTTNQEHKPSPRNNAVAKKNGNLLAQEYKPSPQDSHHDDMIVDAEKKRQDVVNLVKSGIDYLLSHRVEEAFYAFIHDQKFVKGDITLFVLDMNGVIYVHENLEYIWDNLADKKNDHDLSTVALIVAKAKRGGGWLDYDWQHGYKSSYVEKIEKDGVSYIIGAGWFPESKKGTVEDFVKRAVAFFNKEGRELAFTRFNNPIGDFVEGDLYIYAYDAKGYCVAHGDNIGLIGRDLINLKDQNGLLIVQALLKKAQQGGGWVDYLWLGSPKSGYVEKVSDRWGEYIIGSGYHPSSSRNNVTALVKRGVKHFNSWGRERAALDFNQQSGEFVLGDIGLFMYDFKGNVLSQSTFLEYVGQNLFDLRSSSGDYLVQNLIQRAQHGGGWIYYQWRKDLAAAYVEKVSDKDGDYLIGAAFYPDTKKEHVIELVKRGVGYLTLYPKDVAMNEFARRGGPFVRGTLHLFVFNFEGDCLVYGDNAQLTWKNFKDFTDVDGKRVIKLFVTKANAGGGWVKYKSKNAEKVAYIEKVEKDGVPYIIGSAFYL